MLNLGISGVVKGSRRCFIVWKWWEYCLNKNAWQSVCLQWVAAWWSRADKAANVYKYLCYFGIHLIVWCLGMFGGCARLSVLTSNRCPTSLRTVRHKGVFYTGTWAIKIFVDFCADFSPTPREHESLMIWVGPCAPYFPCVLYYCVNPWVLYESVTQSVIYLTSKSIN